MEISHTDLMIGDIIYDMDEIITVTGQDLSYYDDIDSTKIRPVYLDQDFLELNGFICKNEIAKYSCNRDDNGTYFEYNFYSHVLTLWNNTDYGTEIMFRSTVYCVHEMQHAFKMSGVNHTFKIANESIYFDDEY